MFKRVATVLVLVSLGALAVGRRLPAQAPPGARPPAGAGAAMNPPPPVDPAVKALMEARLAAAREAYEFEIQRYTHTMTAPSADTADWSKRWMEDQLALANSPAEALVAIRDHVDRVKRLEGIVKANVEAGQGRPSDASKARYHRIDAELTFAEAKAAYPGVVIPAPAASTPTPAATPAPPPAPPR